jgi:hypothetical protein
MTMAERGISFDDGTGYERFIGRASQLQFDPDFLGGRVHAALRRRVLLTRPLLRAGLVAGRSVQGQKFGGSGGPSRRLAAMQPCGQTRGVHPTC